MKKARAEGIARANPPCSKKGRVIVLDYIFGISTVSMTWITPFD